MFRTPPWSFKLNFEASDKKLKYLNEKMLYNVQEVMEEIEFDMLHVKKDIKQFQLSEILIKGLKVSVAKKRQKLIDIF